MGFTRIFEQGNRGEGPVDRAQAFYAVRAMQLDLIRCACSETFACLLSRNDMSALTWIGMRSQGCWGGTLGNRRVPVPAIPRYIKPTTARW